MELPNVAAYVHPDVHVWSALGPARGGLWGGGVAPQVHGAKVAEYLCPPLTYLWGVLARPASFFDHSPPVPLFSPRHQTIRSTFSPRLRSWPILCTQFRMMARVVVGSGESGILCC